MLDYKEEAEKVSKEINQLKEEVKQLFVSKKITFV